MLYNRSFPDFLIEFPDQLRVSRIPKTASVSNAVESLEQRTLNPLRGIMNLRDAVPANLRPTAEKDDNINLNRDGDRVHLTATPHHPNAFRRCEASHEALCWQPRDNVLKGQSGSDRKSSPTLRGRFACSSGMEGVCSVQIQEQTKHCRP